MIFLLIGTFIFSFFGAFIESISYKLGGGNLVFCALISEVYAYRLANFGYVPAQGYLLLGSIFINIIIFYLADRFYLWLKRNCD
jgi:hypothetical protein